MTARRRLVVAGNGMVTADDGSTTPYDDYQR